MHYSNRGYFLEALEIALPKTVGAKAVIYGCEGVSVAPTEEKGLEIFKIFKDHETFASLSLGYQTGRFLYNS